MHPQHGQQCTETEMQLLRRGIKAREGGCIHDRSKTQRGRWRDTAVCPFGELQPRVTPSPDLEEREAALNSGRTSGAGSAGAEGDAATVPAHIYSPVSRPGCTKPLAKAFF